MSIAEAREPGCVHPWQNHQEIGEACDALRAAILDTSDWRKQEAAEHPGDGRYAAASQLLSAVAASVDDVPDTLMLQYAEAWHDEFAFRTSEAQSALLRDVGFRSASDSATKLIEHLLDHVADARADHARS